MTDYSKKPIEEHTKQELSGRLAFLYREKAHFKKELAILEEEIKMISENLGLGEGK